MDFLASARQWLRVVDMNDRDVIPLKGESVTMKKSAALLACFALALSSCAAAPKDTSLKAQLDFENNYITLPLDEYDMSDQALDITYRAYLLILKECYAKKATILKF